MGVTKTAVDSFVGEISVFPKLGENPATDDAAVGVSGFCVFDKNRIVAIDPTRTNKQVSKIQSFFNECGFCKLSGSLSLSLEGLSFLDSFFESAGGLWICVLTDCIGFLIVASESGAAGEDFWISLTELCGVTVPSVNRSRRFRAASISPISAYLSAGAFAMDLKISFSTSTGNPTMNSPGRGRGSLRCLNTIAMGVSAV